MYSRSASTCGNSTAALGHSVGSQASFGNASARRNVTRAIVDMAVPRSVNAARIAACTRRCSVTAGVSSIAAALDQRNGCKSHQRLGLLVFVRNVGGQKMERNALGAKISEEAKQRLGGLVLGRSAFDRESECCGNARRIGRAFRRARDAGIETAAIRFKARAGEPAIGAGVVEREGKPADRFGEPRSVRCIGAARAALQQPIAASGRSGPSFTSAALPLQATHRVVVSTRVPAEGMRPCTVSGDRHCHTRAEMAGRDAQAVPGRPWPPSPGRAQGGAVKAARGEFGETPRSVRCGSPPEPTTRRRNRRGSDGHIRSRARSCRGRRGHGSPLAPSGHSPSAAHGSGEQFVTPREAQIVRRHILEQLLAAGREPRPCRPRSRVCAPCAPRGRSRRRGRYSCVVRGCPWACNLDPQHHQSPARIGISCRDKAGQLHHRVLGGLVVTREQHHEVTAAL